MAGKNNDTLQEISLKPFITIVIPVRNEERFIEETIQLLLNQDYPPDRFEILVTDGFSTDRTRDIVQSINAKHPNVRLIDNPGTRSSAGRNIGFKKGRGDYFIVIDGHCHIDNDKLFENTVLCFERSGADCLGRPQPLDPPDLTAFQTIVASTRACSIGHGSDSLIYTGYEGFSSPVSNGASYRRDVFEKVGYVDENFDACEDVEFNFRLEKAGLIAYSSPHLRVRYYPRENLKGLYRQMVRYGLGRFRLFQKYPESLTVTTLVPAGLTLLLICTPVATAVAVLSMFSTKGLWPVLENGLSGSILNAMKLPAGLVLVLFTAYLGLIFLFSMRLWRNSKSGGLFLYPPVFFAIHVGLGLGFLRELIGNLPHPFKRSPKK